MGGKYLVQSRAGRGGMARIYRAEQQPLGRTVALKVLIAPRNAEENDPLFHRRFFQEAATIARLKHPNTVTIFDYGHEAELDLYYMVMEFVEGRTLHEVIRGDGPLLPARALRIAHDIARSLQEAHAQGIVHRDLKPSNIMLVETVDGEQVKVLDFGIAKVLQHDAENLTMDDRIVGSPRYMSPEQIRHHAIDGRSDLYSLGVVLYEMVAGTPPFGGDKTLDTLISHLNDPVPALGSRSPYEIPPRLETFVQSLLAKDRDQRPADVAGLRTELRAVLQELADVPTDSGAMIGPAVSGARKLPDPTVESQPTMSRPEVASEGGRSRLWPAMLVGGLAGALAIVALLAGGAWWVSSGAGPEEPAAVAAAPARAPVEPAPAAAPRASAVKVSSTPPGAEVWQGTTLRGVTPIELAHVEGEPPLELELRSAGHEPQKVAHPWSAETSELAVTLKALPAPSPAPKAAPKAQPAKPRPVARPAPAKKPEPGDMDIVNSR